MELYRHSVINLQRIAEVNRQWHEPEYDWGPRTASGACSMPPP